MSVNKVILIGRLGRNPEVRYQPNGEAIASFSIATDEQWKDRNGERQTRTEWHNITLFGKLGEIAGKYLQKGSQVFIEGRIQSRKYTGKDGIERTAISIIGSEMKMLGSRNDASPNPTQKAAVADHGNQYLAASTGSYGVTPPRQPAPSVQPIDNIDDDIPF